MSEKVKCGDVECWCATMSTRVSSVDCKEKLPADLQREPFHRGWWKANHPNLGTEKKP